MLCCTLGSSVLAVVFCVIREKEKKRAGKKVSLRAAYILRANKQETKNGVRKIGTRVVF